MRILNKGQSLAINLLRTIKHLGIVDFKKIILGYGLGDDVTKNVNIKVIWE